MFKSAITQELQISASTFCRRLKILCEDSETPFKYNRVKTMKFLPLAIAQYIINNL